MKKILHTSTKKLDPFNLTKNKIVRNYATRRISRRGSSRASRRGSKHSSSAFSSSPPQSKKSRNNLNGLNGIISIRKKSRFLTHNPIRKREDSSKFLSLVPTNNRDINSESQSFSSATPGPKRLL